MWSKVILAVLIRTAGASTRNQNELGITLTGTNSMSFTIPLEDTDTAGVLLSKVATKLNVQTDYIVLFKEDQAVDGMGRVVYRRNSARIGVTSSASTKKLEDNKSLTELGVKSGDTLTCLLRPLKGDHIHYAYAAYVHGELVDVMYDNDWVGTPFANEGNTYPATFSDLAVGLNDYHIVQTHPHFGVHAGQPYWFGDGFIHVHPGTAWGWFRGTEGLGATLSAFLEQTGVALWQSASSRYPIGSLHVPIPLEDNGFDTIAVTFPDKTGGATAKVGGTYDCSIIADGSDGRIGQNTGGHPLRDFETTSHEAVELTPSRILIHSTATHMWRAYYYSHYSQDTPAVVEYGIGELWLKNNLGMVVLSYERRDKDTSIDPPRPPQCMIDLLSNQRVLDGKEPVKNQVSGYYTLGFDGYYYPMPNDPEGVGIPPGGLSGALLKISTEDRSPLL